MIGISSIRQFEEMTGETKEESIIFGRNFDDMDVDKPKRDEEDEEAENGKEEDKMEETEMAKMDFADLEDPAEVSVTKTSSEKGPSVPFSHVHPYAARQQTSNNQKRKKNRRRKPKSVLS